MSAAAGVTKAGRPGGGGTQIDAKRPKFAVAHIAGAGWIVLDPEGAKCGGIFANRDQALTRRDGLQSEADRRAKRGERACMCCCQKFDSEGIHNRLCPSCKGRGGAYSPHAMVLPRRRTS